MKPPRQSLQILPSGDLQHLVDFRGCGETIVEIPVTLQCDYCMRPADRLWRYVVRPVCAPAIGNKVKGRRGAMQYEGGTWNACVYCHPLMHDARAMVARAFTMNPELAEIPASYFEAMFQGIWAAITSGPITWEAGQEWKPQP